jgi:hypothetical protein
MHSATSFFGVLIFGWGLGGLQVVDLIVTVPGIDHEPWQPVADWWPQHIVAALMLPAPLMLYAMDVAVVRWGLLDG